jgi:hypothetical protein
MKTNKNSLKKLLLCSVLRRHEWIRGYEVYRLGLTIIRLRPVRKCSRCECLEEYADVRLTDQHGRNSVKRYVAARFADGCLPQTGIGLTWNAKLIWNERSILKRRDRIRVSAKRFVIRVQSVFDRSNERRDRRWKGYHFKLWNGLPATINIGAHPTLPQLTQPMITLKFGDETVNLLCMTDTKIGDIIRKLMEDDYWLSFFNKLVYEKRVYFACTTAFETIMDAVRTRNPPKIQALME